MPFEPLPTIEANACPKTESLGWTDPTKFLQHTRESEIAAPPIGKPGFDLPNLIGCST